MSSPVRFLKLQVSRFSSQPPASNIMQLMRHHSLANNSGYRYLSNYTRIIQKYNTQTRCFSVNSDAGGVQPSAPLPSQPPPSNFMRWILGLMVTIAVPSTSNTWSPLLQIKNEVDTVVETIEEITHVVERVAEIVDKVAEEISDNLPEGGKAKKMVDIAEDVAEAAARDARTIGDAIDKFQEMEEKVENIVGIQ